MKPGRRTLRLDVVDAYKANAAAARRQAQPARERSRALRALAEVLECEARDNVSARMAKLWRHQGRLAALMAGIVGREAVTFDREADRAESQARMAGARVDLDAQSSPGRSSASPSHPRARRSPGRG